MYIAKKIILVLSLLLGFAACEDSNDNSSIPDFAVYLERNVNLEAIELRTIGGYKTYLAAEKYGEACGYGGIIIFYGYDEIYSAFDLCCPYEKKREVRALPNDLGQCVCPSCGSTFNVGYGIGNCVAGPAKEGLKKYTITKYNSTAGLILKVTR